MTAQKGKPIPPPDKSATIPQPSSIPPSTPKPGTTISIRASPSTGSISSLESSVTNTFSRHNKSTTGIITPSRANNNTTTTSPNAQFRMNMNMGEIFLHKRRYSSSNKNFLTALQVATSLYGDDHIVVAGVYDKLGDVATKSGNTYEGRRWYKKALNLLKKATVKCYAPPMDDSASGHYKQRRRSRDRSRSSSSNEEIAKGLNKEEMRRAISNKLESTTSTAGGDFRSEDVSGTDGLSIDASSSMANTTIATLFATVSRGNDDVDIVLDDDRDDNPSDAHYQLGLQHMKQQRYRDARAEFQKSLDDNTVVASNGDDDASTAAPIRRRLGDACFALEDYDEARLHYDAALIVYRRRRGDDDDERGGGGGAVDYADIMAKILIRLGRIHRKARRFDECVNCFEEACLWKKRRRRRRRRRRRQDDTTDEDDDDEETMDLIRRFVEAREEMARVAKTDDVMLEHYNEALSMMRPYVVDVTTTSETNNNYTDIERRRRGRDRFKTVFTRIAKRTAGIYASKENYSFAIDVLLEVLMVRTEYCTDYSKLDDDTKLKAAIILHNMAVFYERRKSYDEAKEHFETSLALKRDVHGDDDVKIAKTLNCLGYVHFLSGEDDRALDNFEKATRLWRREGIALTTTGGGSEYLTTLKRMIGLYDKLKRDYEAERCRDEMERLRRTQDGVDYDLYQSLMTVGRESLRRNDCETAKDRFTKALALAGSMSDGDSELAEISRYLGSCYAILGVSEKALACYEKSLRSSGDLEKVVVLTRMGVIHTDNDDHKSALKCHNTALAVESVQKGQQYIVVVVHRCGIIFVIVISVVVLIWRGSDSGIIVVVVFLTPAKEDVSGHDCSPPRRSLDVRWSVPGGGGVIQQLRRA